MNLLSAPVLGAAALLAGPTLWQGLVTGVVPLEHALTRYGVTVALVWLALSAVVMLVESTGEPRLQPTGVSASGGEPSADDLEGDAGGS
jgi:hypothetical protein